MDKDSETLWGKLTVIERQGKYYGQLDFDNSMIRYAVGKIFKYRIDHGR